MSSPTAIEASLRLDIAQLKAQMAEARGEAKRWREKAQEEGRKAAQAVDPVIKAHAEAASRMAATKAINPWTTASAGAMEYKRVLDSMTPAMMKAHSLLAASGQRTQALFAPQQVNPWTTASAGWKPAERPERLPQMAFMSRYDNTLALQQQAKQERQAAATATGRGSGAGLRGLGQASMQAQDIAVQLQMGTRASIVLAQQGSQLLSAFGPAGAIAGGVVAIGGAFFLMGQKAREAFDEARVEADKFDSELKTILTGSVSDLVGGLGMVSDRIRSAADELKSLDGKFGFVANIADIFDGPSVEERMKQASDLLTKAGEDRVKVANRLIELSAEEAKIAGLRSQGEKIRADEMQRQLDLKRELQRIDDMQVPRFMREQLADDARSKSDSGAVTPRDAVQDKEEILRLDKQIEETRRRTLDPVDRFVALAGEESKLFEQMANSSGAFFERSVAGLDAWAEAKRKAGDTAGLIKALDLREKVGAVQQQMGQANDEAVQARDKRDTETDNNREAAERVKLARETFDLETKIAREQAASGLEENAKVKAFRDELNTLQLTAQVQAQLNVSQKEAAKLARERVEAERAAFESIKAQTDAKQKYGALKDIATELKVDALRAAGRDKAADKVEREGRIQSEAESIQDATGFSGEKSESLARKHMADQEKAQHRAALRDWNAGGQVGPMPRRAIRSERDGSTRARMSDYDMLGKQGTAYSRLQKGKSDFQELQGRTSDFAKLQAGESAWDKLQAKAPLNDQHAQNAAAAAVDPAAGRDNNASHQAKVEQLLQELNETWRELMNK